MTLTDLPLSTLYTLTVHRQSTAIIVDNSKCIWNKVQQTTTTYDSCLCLPYVSRKCNDNDLQITPSSRHNVKQENCRQAATEGDISKPVEEITSQQKQHNFHRHHLHSVNLWPRSYKLFSLFSHTSLSSTTQVEAHQYTSRLCGFTLIILSGATWSITSLRRSHPYALRRTTWYSTTSTHLSHATAQRSATFVRCPPFGT